MKLKTSNISLTLTNVNLYFGTSYTASQAANRFTVLAMTRNRDACRTCLDAVQFLPSQNS